MFGKLVVGKCRSFVRSRSFINPNLVPPIISFATQKKSFFLDFKMSSNESRNETSEPKVKLAEEEWKKKLTPEQYSICREKGTEIAFSGKYYHHNEEGVYTCVACNTPLFSSDTKYDSGSGWPSFHTAYGAKDGDETDANVVRQQDNSCGYKRTEVLCKQCHAHLGHVFDDGPKPTGERFCVNSVSLNFKSSKE